MTTLSIIMPVYNEANSIRQILEQLGAADIPVTWELIVVDDGSHDGSLDLVDRDLVPTAERVITVRSRSNRGKGSALRKGFSLASGEILGVQDADLEYDPQQIPELISHITEDRAEVVFGTRQFGAHASYSFWYVVGNRLISLAASMLFDRYVTDAYTCYKFFRREHYDQLRLTANGFEIEAELTGGLLRNGARVFEQPINYSARGRHEGKKIRPRDGVKGVARLARVRIRGW